MSSLLHFDVIISDVNTDNDLRKIIPQLRPEWKDKDVKITMRPRNIECGIINLMVIGHVSSGMKDAIMFRIRRNEQVIFNDLFDRDNEISNIRMLRETYKFKFVPNILASFKNGFCYDYIEGEVMSREMAISNWRTMAKQLAMLHSIPLDEKLKQQKSKVYQFVEQMFYPDKFDDPEKNEKLQKYLPSNEWLKKERQVIVQHLEKLKCEIVFSHSDPRLGNIVCNEKTGEITLVDWEISGVNVSAYDIAYHFSSFAGFENADFSIYPKKEWQLQWLRVYLQTYYGIIKPNYQVSDDDIDKLYAQVSCAYLFNLLQYTTWLGAFDQANFDALEFCIKCYNEYRLLKEKILALK